MTSIEIANALKELADKIYKSESEKDRDAFILSQAPSTQRILLGEQEKYTPGGPGTIRVISQDEAAIISRLKSGIKEMVTTEPGVSGERRKKAIRAFETSERRSKKKKRSKRKI